MATAYHNIIAEKILSSIQSSNPKEKNCSICTSKIHLSELKNKREETVFLCRRCHVFVKKESSKNRKTTAQKRKGCCSSLKEIPRCVCDLSKKNCDSCRRVKAVEIGVLHTTADEKKKSFSHKDKYFTATLKEGSDIQHSMDISNKSNPLPAIGNILSSPAEPLITVKKSEKELLSPFLTLLPESEDETSPRRRSRRTRKTVNYANLGETEKPLAKPSPNKPRQKKRKINEEVQPKKQSLQHKKQQKKEQDPYNEPLPESETESTAKVPLEDNSQMLNGQFKVLSRQISANSAPTGTTTPNSPSSLFQKGTRKRQILASFRKSMLQQHGGSPVAKKSRKINSF